MTQITYRDWIFDSDVDQTRAGYETITAGGAETCNCAGCRNFLAQRDSIFPAEVLQLFLKLGVDYKRDAEIYHTARLELGRHLYGGWFHFVGIILKKPVGPATLDKFTIEFIANNALAAEVLKTSRSCKSKSP
jgi:hypothetical protein